MTQQVIHWDFTEDKKRIDDVLINLIVHGYIINQVVPTEYATAHLIVDGSKQIRKALIIITVG